MSKFKTYTEWRTAVKAEYDKLDACLEWLSSEGEERRMAYYTLWDLSNFCTDAQELIDWTETRDGLNCYERKYLDSIYTATPIARLRDLVAAEN